MRAAAIINIAGVCVASKSPHSPLIIDSNYFVITGYFAATVLLGFDLMSQHRVLM
jgi:hypothetical protein